VSQQGNLDLTSVKAGRNIDIVATTGNLTVGTVDASNSATLTATAGSLTNDGDSAEIAANTLTFLATSIGTPATLTGSTPNDQGRLNTDATTLVATSTNGGVYIDQLVGLASANVKASGKNGNIELATRTGDINILGMSASGTLLLAAGGNIYGLANSGTITAQSAELRAGVADSTTGRIGTLSHPLVFDLNPGTTLRLFVPLSIAGNSSDSPATLTSPGVTSTLAEFVSPSALALEDGFGQFQGLGESQFTSQAELLVHSIQNQTATVQSVVGLDWSSFDPNVSLFGKLDPSVCLPGDQRDEEEGTPGKADRCVAK
jgi:hypothetical protein